MDRAMQFKSLLSVREDSADAVAEIVAKARGIEPDLAFVFFTADYRAEVEEIVEKLWLELDPQVMIGCSAEGVIAEDHEVERAPGIAVLVGEMPEVRLHPCHIGRDEWRRLLLDSEEMLERLGSGDETRAIIGFGDPFTCPVNQFLPRLGEIAPRVPLIGGMASGARIPGDNILVRNDQNLDDGFVGISISGPLIVETIVSQGCRPIGQPMLITKGHENVIEQLGGRPAVAALREMVDSLSEQDQNLLGSGLLVGLVIDEYKESFDRGDFLVRNLVGIDENAGAIAVADRIRVGQTVRFQVRDAASATSDFSLLLESQKNIAPAAGGLLVSCNGRGCRLFDQPGHDIRLVHQHLPETPIAGFFAAGELGPIGGKNFIHGHTASLALFRPK